MKLTYEEAKNELELYRKTQLYLKSCELKIQEIDQRCNGNAGMTFSDTPGTQGGLKKTTSQKYAELLDLKDDWAKELEAHEKVFLKYISKRISYVAYKDKRAATLLNLYYIQGIKAFEIAADMNYDYDYVRKLLSKAIRLYADTDVETEKQEVA